MLFEQLSTMSIPYSVTRDWGTPSGLKLLHTLLKREILSPLDVILTKFLWSHSPERDRTFPTFEFLVPSVGPKSQRSMGFRSLGVPSSIIEVLSVCYWDMRLGMGITRYKTLRHVGSLFHVMSFSRKVIHTVRRQMWERRFISLIHLMSTTA